ncbi:MAG: SMC-Scp complex subunit ScpB [Gammaproteobacteria bacterium]|nr:SMC-Scp complex subunit ScpB [Gammaproteobacteria bacterium]
MKNDLLKNIIEAALLASGRPLSLSELRDLFPHRQRPELAALRNAIKQLQSEFEGRGIELIEVATGFRIQVRPSMIDWLTKLWEERPPRYSRALMETLALIAYQQPITRGDIENVRGVAVSANIIRTMLERGWIKVVGHRDVPGKPELFATTPQFLEYFSLKKLDDLPPLADITDLDTFVPQLEFDIEESIPPLRVVTDHGELLEDEDSSEDDVNEALSDDLEDDLDDAEVVEENIRTID